MALDKSTIRDRVRAMIGNPSTDDLADSLIEYFIDVAVLEITEKDEGDNASVGTLTTVADKQDYVPATGAAEIINVYWRGDATAATTHSDIQSDANAYLIDYPGPVGDLGFHMRALDLIHEMKVDRWYNISSRGFNWDYLDGKIWLDPPPSESGLTVYYIYASSTADISSLGDEKQRGILYFACWQCLLTVANARSGAGVMFREGVEGERGASLLVDNAERYKEMWDDFVLDMTGGRF